MAKYDDSMYPLVVPVFNNPTYLKNFYEQVRNLEIFEFNIYDNGSTYPEMINLLEELKTLAHVNVYKFQKNFGPHYCLRNPDIYKDLPEIFCLSDPDVEFSKLLPKNFLTEMIEISNEYAVGKVGFAIEIPKEEEFLEPYIKMDGNLQRMVEWEQQFWQNKIGETNNGDPIYLTTLDTQFAVYNKKFFNPQDRYRAIRIGGKYTSKHLGFYKDSIVPAPEQDYYKKLSRFAYYIGNFDEEGNPTMQMPVHEYYLILEKSESLERELKRVSHERDEVNTELQKFYASNSWKILNLLIRFKKFLVRR